MADLRNDIEKYLNGELTPQEMHALEKKALQDPFLADALEGAGELSPVDFHDDLKVLQASLTNRIQQKENKHVSLWGWTARIAAGFLLVASATVGVIYLTADKGSDQLALNKETPAPLQEQNKNVEPSVSDTVAADAKADENIAGLKSEGKARKETQIAADKANDDALAARSEPAPVSQPEAEATEELGPAPKADEVHSATEIIVEKKIAQAAPAAPAIQSRQKDEARRSTTQESDKAKSGASANSLDGYSSIKSSRIVKGQVTTDDGDGLPGVNVMQKGTNVGTVTDALGYYQIAVNPATPDLIFSFIGYTNTEVATDQKDEVNVKLEEDVSQLSEVVVTGYSSPRDQEDVISTLELATPAGGRRAFKQYLEKNMNYPVLALNSKIQGRVTIQFAVESTGELSEFKVLKGIGGGCEEEVIRLIKQGPKWTPTKRDKNSLRDTVKVRMRFQLPEKK